MDSGKRNIQIHFMVSPEEKQAITLKMKEIGTKNMGAYLRKMSIDGLVVVVDTSDVRELVRLLRVTSNSLNQLTKRVHETGRIYGEDIEDLKKSYDKMWGVAEEIMERLAGV